MAIDSTEEGCEESVEIFPEDREDEAITTTEENLSEDSAYPPDDFADDSRIEDSADDCSWLLNEDA